MFISSKLKFMTAMLIFGSIGIFVRKIELSSAAIVHWRTLIGSVFLLLMLSLRKEAFDMNGVQKNRVGLIFAGVVLGGNWICLFEAYRYASVGIATMLYYCAPIAVYLLSPMLFRERLTMRKSLGMAAALAGMLVIQFAGSGMGGLSVGIIYGLLSALLYASLMIINKRIQGVGGLESTFIQLLVSFVVMTVYLLVTTGKLLALPVGRDIFLICIVGIIHTGIAFSLYISSMQRLSGSSISLLSYIDPASALLFAFAFLHERLTLVQLLGAVLIFGGTLFSQCQKSSSKSKALKESLTG